MVNWAEEFKKLRNDENRMNNLCNILKEQIDQSKAHSAEVFNSEKFNSFIEKSSKLGYFSLSTFGNCDFSGFDITVDDIYEFVGAVADNCEAYHNSMYGEVYLYKNLYFIRVHGQGTECFICSLPESKTESLLPIDYKINVCHGNIKSDNDVFIEKQIKKQQGKKWKTKVR